MTPTTQARYDAEETRKELLATLHASRELGPEMDDTLTDRFVERLGALRPAGSFDPTQTRADLRALLTSARGSDPTADDALVDSFIANIQPPKPVAPAYGPYGPYPPADVEFGPMVRVRNNDLARIAPVLFMVAIFVGSMALSHGHTVWLIFPLLFLLNMDRRNRYRRRMERDQRRLYRDQRRYYRDQRIIRPDDPYHQIPPSGPPEIL